ncbi:hypothetical protein ACN9MB_13315 [Dyella kyungheensis]|uniref:hypothetical protein n=1 Tax=Dyella kyungheensis TaxID=1242174 RepID=UPI003CEFF257
MFDAQVFDNTATGQREVWINGRCTRYFRKNAICPHAVWEVMRPPWGISQMRHAIRSRRRHEREV